MAGPAEVMDEVLLDEVDGHYEFLVQGYIILGYLCNGIFVINLENELFHLEVGSTYEDLPNLVGVDLLKDPLPYGFANVGAGAITVGNIIRRGPLLY